MGRASIVMGRSSTPNRTRTAFRSCGAWPATAAPRRSRPGTADGRPRSGPDALYFDQLEVVRNAGLQFDLYRVERSSGHVTRLTYGARLTDPDLSPDGTKLAAIRIGHGSRSLVLLDRSTLDRSHRRKAGWEHPLLVAGDDRTVMAAPRWSPDGRYIALESRRHSGPSEIVVLEVATGMTHVVTASPRGRNVTPAWTPDGRFIVFSSDRDGGPFVLYRVDARSDGKTDRDVERLPTPAGGARSPDVSPDGQSVVFVGYTAEGFDVFSVALPQSAGSVTPVGEPQPGITDSGRRYGEPSNAQRHRMVRRIVRGGRCFRERGCRYSTRRMTKCGLERPRAERIRWDTTRGRPACRGPSHGIPHSTRCRPVPVRTSR